MRILFVVHQFYPEFSSGTERVTLGLARMAQRAGHHVQVLACMIDRRRHAGQPCDGISGAISSVVDGIPVTMLDRARLPPGADAGLEVDEAVRDQVEEWLRRQRFELVHLLHPMRMATIVAAIQRRGLPLVVTLTDFFFACLRVNLIDVDGRTCSGPEGGVACARRCQMPAWSQPALQARYRHAKAMLEYASSRVAPSRYVARRISESFDGMPVDVIAHGVDLLELAAARPLPVAKSTGLITLGFVGSLVEAKGLHVLLRAFARNPQLPLRLKVVGGFHGDALYQQQLRAMAGADARVELLGPLTPRAVAEVMHGIDLLCLPSIVPESFSLVVHECAALGVPSLVSDRGAPAEAIAANGAGQVVAAGDEAAWAAALESLVAEPERLRRWCLAVPLPQRIEEEAFLYEGLYRRALGCCVP